MKTNEEKRSGLPGAFKNLLEKIFSVKKKKNDYPFALQPIPVRKEGRQRP